MLTAHLRTGDDSIEGELLPQFLIINRVIQVLNIEVYTLEEKSCMIGAAWAMVGPPEALFSHLPVSRHRRHPDATVCP